MELSVILPVFNAEKYLNEAISSILSQTLEDFELIIINDGSDDGSIDIIKSFRDTRIVLIDQENKGLAKSLNIGIAISKTEYIARMDADDISVPSRLAEQLHFLKSHPECVVVGSNAMIIDEQGKYLYTSKVFTEWEAIKNCLPENPLYHSSTMFRKKYWDLAGGYFEKVTRFYFEDKILWNSMAKFGQIRNIEEPLIYYRIVPSSISNKTPKIAKEITSICNTIVSTGDLSTKQLTDLHNLSERDKINQRSNYYLKLSNIYRKERNERFRALSYALKSLFYSPLHTHGWINFARCLLS